MNTPMARLLFCFGTLLILMRMLLGEWTLAISVAISAALVIASAEVIFDKRQKASDWKPSAIATAWIVVWAALTLLVGTLWVFDFVPRGLMIASGTSVIVGLLVLGVASIKMILEKSRVR